MAAIAKSTIRQSIDDVREAAHQSVAAVKELLGKTTNPDVRLYNSLTPADFDDIAKTYGADEMIRYVRTMEMQRLGGK